MSNTDMVNNIPIIEKLISIKKEAFSSFNNPSPSSLSLKYDKGQSMTRV